ncbi:MAG: hypothetical protein ACOCZB_04860 [Spirochaetota bacterium]
MSDKSQTRNLRRLRRLYRKLDTKGGPEEDGELFEETLRLEEDILELAGLAPTATNTALLYKLKDQDNAGAAVAFVQSLLHIASLENKQENYAPLEILAQGIANRETPFDVLPQMGLITHEYTLYLYELLLDEPSELLDVYNELMRTRELLEPISLLKQRYDELKGMNVRFLERFLQAQADEPAEPRHAYEETEQRSAGYIAHVAHVAETDEPGEYSVRFTVVSAHEIQAVQEATDKNKEPPVVHAHTYDMVISLSGGDRSMMPDDDLEECMEVYHEHEHVENLNPSLRRMWKTAYIADNITATLFNSGVLEVWDSEKVY